MNAYHADVVCAFSREKPAAERTTAVLRRLVAHAGATYGLLTEEQAEMWATLENLAEE
mgnify:CR=1 FL=1